MILSFRLFLEGAAPPYYAASPHDYSELRPGADGILWLDRDRLSAEGRSDRPWVKHGHKHVWAVDLDPSAVIVDLKDWQRPAVRRLKEMVPAWKAIPENKWAAHAGLDLLDGRPWVPGFLRAMGVDGVRVGQDVAHEPVALFNPARVTRAERYLR